MAAHTIGFLWDRVNTLVCLQGYSRALRPFDFDSQPDTNLEKVFCLASVRTATDGYIGGDQAELHECSLYLAQKAKRDAWGVARQLKADMDLIEQALYRDAERYDYGITEEGTESEIMPAPPGARDFVVSRLRFVLDFDREIS